MCTEEEATKLSAIVGHIWTSDAVPLAGRTETSVPEILANLKTGYNLRDFSGLPTGEGGGLGVTPTPEIPKALQNRAKLNPIVKTVRNC